MSKYYKVYVKPKDLPYNMFSNVAEWAKEWLEDGTYIIVDDHTIIISNKIRKEVLKSEIPQHAYGVV